MLQFPPFGDALDVGQARPCTSHSTIPPVWWRWGRGSGRRGAQSADHLGEKRWQWGVVGEVVYVVGKTVSDMVCRSHTNPLLRTLTGYFARQPAIPCGVRLVLLTLR